MPEFERMERVRLWGEEGRDDDGNLPIIAFEGWRLVQEVREQGEEGYTVYRTPESKIAIMGEREKEIPIVMMFDCFEELEKVHKFEWGWFAFSDEFMSEIADALDAFEDE